MRTLAGLALAFLAGIAMHKLLLLVRRQGERTDHRAFHRSAAAFFGTGVLVLVVQQYLEAVLGPSAGWTHIGLALLEKLGIAFLLFAALHLLIEMPSWRQYFERRLASVVLGDEHLRTLDEAALNRLLAAALRAQFRNQDIDRPGGFFEYFRSHLHRFLHHPFRENVEATLRYIEDADPQYLWVEDEMSYLCRAAGSSIQPEVRVRFVPGEAEELTGTFILTPPEEASLKEFKQEFSISSAGGTAFVTLGDVGLDKCDRLAVRTSMKYKTRRDAFQSWTMTVPTKGFQLTLLAPVGYRVALASFLQLKYKTETYPGYYRLAYSSWMLPKDGVAWQIVPESLERKEALREGDLAAKLALPADERPPASPDTRMEGS